MIKIFFFILVILVILQRIGELQLAKKNAGYLQSIGGYEVGKEHYKWLVLLHILFFVVLVFEYIYFKPSLPNGWWAPFSLFMMAQGLRIWTIASLGPYWNTRIYVVPGAAIQQKGPYRLLRHPNYLIVMMELITLPLVFGLYFTASVIPAINLVLLNYRIRVEEKALKEVTSYAQVMKNVPSIIPFWRRSE